MADIDGALQRLRCDHLDAMLLHSYDLDALRRGEALAVLQAAKQAGKILAYGYSGDGARAQWALTHGGIDVLECSLNLVDQHNNDLLPVAAEKGVAVIAKRPLANSAWRIAEADAREFTAYVRRFAALQLQPTDYQCQDMAELALRYVISLPAQPVAIVGSGSLMTTKKYRCLAARSIGASSGDAAH